MTDASKPSFKPRLQALLQALRMDVVYERGAGEFLYYRDRDGAEVEVLDLVGGYGSVLFGHAHPVLVAEAQRLLASGRPFHAQGSRRQAAEQLAGELSRRCGGDYCVVFGNSGTEAVEAALKHAMLETGARTFITVDRGFHGKTLGALQLTADPTHREPYTLSGPAVIRVAANDLAALEAAFAAAPEVAGFVFEPVQGEGGVRPLSEAFLQRAAALCQARNVPLIADECQTGLGRAGTFLACEQRGVRPDYIVLSKALGGGLAKISALLVQRKRYNDRFDLQHSSTYADDDFSCELARRTLALVDDALLADCREKGRDLLQRLQDLARRFPHVVADVRGAGLMLAVEFRPLTGSSSFLLRFASAQEELAYLATSYLLHGHRIRVAPTLSQRFTLRIEPAASLAETSRDRLLAALEDLCGRLAAADVLGLTRHLIDATPAALPSESLAPGSGTLFAYDAPRFHHRQIAPPAVKAAWLCHLIDAGDLVSLEPAFGALDPAQREQYLGRFAAWSAPVILSAVDVRSRTGALARLYPVLLPFTSRWAKTQLEQRRLQLPQSLVQDGVDLARQLGCDVVSLGQYTSILTRNGTRVHPRGLGVTTGNSYAVALALEAIERAERESGRPPQDATLVIVGAAGNIGQVCAELLAPRYRRTILLGSARPGSWQRLQAVAARVPRANVSTDASAVHEGDVVVAAVNAVDTPLSLQDFAPGAIFCDLSVPASFSASAAAARSDVHRIKGGIAALPGGEDLEIVDFPLPPGQAYGCLAEALLLAWAGVRDTAFTGPLSAAHVTRVAGMAAHHGFRLADFRRNCVLGSDPAAALHASPR